LFLAVKYFVLSSCSSTVKLGSSYCFSLPPRTATQDWLLRATRKFEKSIYRVVEFKYRNIISALSSRIKEFEAKQKEHDDWKELAYDDISRLEQELVKEQEKVEVLEEKLKQYEEPSLTVDEQEESTKYLTARNKAYQEEKKTQKVTKELVPLFEEETSFFSDYTILQRPQGTWSPIRSTSPPGSPKKKKRERSTSPKPSDPQPIHKKQERNIPQTKNFPPSFVPFPASGVPTKANKKKRKRKREKDKT